MNVIVVKHQYRYRNGPQGADTVWGVYSDAEHAASAVERAERLDPGHIDPDALHEFVVYAPEGGIIESACWTFETYALDDVC